MRQVAVKWITHLTKRVQAWRTEEGSRSLRLGLGPCVPRSSFYRSPLAHHPVAPTSSDRNDPLLLEGVYTRERQKQLRDELHELAVVPMRFGLSTAT